MPAPSPLASDFSLETPPICLDWGLLRQSPDPLGVLLGFIEHKAEDELDILLAQASSFGWAQAAALLLDAGADPNAVTRLDEIGSALSHACVNGHLETCELLLTRGANARQCPGAWRPCAHDAAIGLNVECVKALLRSDPSASYDLDGAFLRLCAYQWSPDIWSSQACLMAQTLLSLGARVDASSAQKRSALHFCCARGDDAIHQTRSLLECGAHPSPRDLEGATPMAALFSRYEGGAETLRALLDAEADPSIADNSGVSPLNSPEQFHWSAGRAILIAWAERSDIAQAVPSPNDAHKTPRI